MNPRLFSNSRLALRQIQHNRGRSVLTMLGIIVGVAAVILIVAIGEGVKQQVSQESGYLGKDVVTVQPDQTGSLLQGSGAPLTEADRAKVASLPGVADATLLARLSGTITTQQVKNGQATIIATGNQAGVYLNHLLAYGTFFNNDDSENATAVIGEHVAAKLFKEEVPLGQTFTFRGQQFIVQGVLNRFSNTPLSPTASLNDSIFIPYDTATQLLGTSPAAYQLLAKVKNSQQIAPITKALTISHGGQQDFNVALAGQAVSGGSTTLDILAMAITGTAALSLLVAGIGIMNVMLVSVTERTHEIGIRKAVGATNRQIFNQFAVEALVLSVGGGLIGIAVAYAGDGLLRVVTDLRPVINWQIVVMACGVTAVIGFVFGSAPAIKAARKDPIAALRSE